MGINLEIISNEIREILEEKRKNLQLTFEEEEHIYTMLPKKNLEVIYMRKKG